MLEPRRVARALLQRFRLEHGRCAAQRSPPAIHGGIAPRALSCRPRFEREPPSLPCTVDRRWNNHCGPHARRKKRETTLLAHLIPRSATPCHSYTTVNEIHARMDGRHALFVVERSASLMLVLSREAGGPGSQAAVRRTLSQNLTFYAGIPSSAPLACFEDILRGLPDVRFCLPVLDKVHRRWATSTTSAVLRLPSTDPEAASRSSGTRY